MLFSFLGSCLHYYFLSQRPTTGVSRLNPFDYLNLVNKNAGGFLNNPNLKPQITTEYELGFKQRLTEKSALKVSAYYRELRDLVQTRAFTQAYPITYVAYDNLERFFPKEKLIKTGNPVRRGLLEIENKTVEAKKELNLKHEKYTLLVIGGSLGSRRINQLIEKELDVLDTQNVQIIWQCGKLYYQEYKINGDIKDVQVHAFLNRMDMAYAAADIIISRAGASSVSELCIVGKPVIFIPSPNVAEDHQTKNAMAVVDKNAAILFKQSELGRFQSEFENLLNDEGKQKQLSENIKQLALPKATEHIANEVARSSISVRMVSQFST